MKRSIGKAVLAPTGPVPLSAGIDAGHTLFLSDQLALVGGQLIGDDVAKQTGIAICNIAALLDQAGLSLADVIKTTVWLSRPEDFTAFNAAYAERFGPAFPARSTVVSTLLIPGALLEIEAIAVRP